MKKLLLLLTAILTLSCEKEGDLIKNANETNAIDNTAVLKYSGTFQPTSGINVDGGVNIFLQNNVYQLQIENITISDGPDLKVYLSKSSTPSDFLNLGNFKGNGTSVYTIPQGVNVSEYTHALIHCQQYNHLFAVAELISK